MREILFRGKRMAIGPFNVAKGEEWVYGGYAKDSSGVYIYDHMRAYRMVKVVPDTVGQYIGLKDMNGVKIYEGDIIRGEGSKAKLDNFVVRWVAPCCGFTAGEGKRVWPNLNQGTVSEYWVIGNIYENPELMREKDGNG